MDVEHRHGGNRASIAARLGCRANRFDGAVETGPSGQAVKTLCIVKHEEAWQVSAPVPPRLQRYLAADSRRVPHGDGQWKIGRHRIIRARR